MFVLVKTPLLFLSLGPSFVLGETMLTLRLVPVSVVPYVMLSPWVIDYKDILASYSLCVNTTYRLDAIKLEEVMGV